MASHSATTAPVVAIGVYPDTLAVAAADRERGVLALALADDDHERHSVVMRQAIRRARVSPPASEPA